SEWIDLSFFEFRKRTSKLHHAHLMIPEESSESEKRAAEELFQKVATKDLRLFVGDSDVSVDLNQAFLGAINSSPGLQTEISFSTNPMPVAIHATYPDETDCYYLRTAAGLVRVCEIRFDGEIFEALDRLPIA